MRAARLYGARDVRIEDVQDPVADRGEVLLRVRAVTICPSDWRMYADGHAGGVVPEHPIIQGHEFSGDVAALGADVNEPAIGTRVAVEPSWPCMSCDMCHAGRANICRNVRFPSFPPVDGALAEFIACPASAVVPLPDDLGYHEGALVEPLGVSLHAVRLAGVQRNERICILGAGIIGIGVLQLALLAGCAGAAVVEPVSDRHRLVGENAGVSASVDQLPAGFESDVVFECSGDIAGLDQAVRVARPGGRILVVGIPREEMIRFDMATARRRELTVTFTRRSHGTLEECIDLLASRRLDWRHLPMARFPLAGVDEALRLTGRPGPVLRAVVEP